MAEDLFRIVGSLQLGTFRVRKVVAEGGFAVVYRAHHEGFAADVALKCLKIPGTISAENQGAFLEKFREEAQLLFRLSAAIPAVVRPLQVGTLDDAGGQFVPFLALEWLDGQSMADYLESRIAQGKGPLELERAVLMLTPVAEGLAAAHRFDSGGVVVSVIHRDLKPENLFLANVSGNRVVKILDFGIAKVKNAATQLAGHQSSEATALSAFTPAYAAPEQWLPKRYGQTGTWTDVWGLAITMVELLTGKSPLDGDAHAIMGSAIDPERRPTPRAEGLATSDAVERVFRRALAVDPRERYQDVLVFWKELESAVGIVRARPVHRRVDSIPPLESRPPSSGAPTQLGVGPDIVAGGGLPGFIAGSPTPEPQSPIQLAGVGLSPHSGGYTAPLPLSSSRGRPPPARAMPAPQIAHSARADRRSLLERLWIPMQLILFAGLVRLGEAAWEQGFGAPLDLGGFRLFWVYGPFGVIGVILLIVALFSAS